MTTYAIGDIHGCYRTFRRLLRRIGFRADRDRLWLVGDLVNRGPQSLDVLRWVFDQRGCVEVVLGNHDLHLIGRAAGLAQPRRSDTLDALLAAPDCDELVSWLRMQRLLCDDGARLMVHAGLLPQWSAEDAVRVAREAERQLHGEGWQALLQAILSCRPDEAGVLVWSEALPPLSRMARTVGVLARIRMCWSDGRMQMRFKGHPDDAPAGLAPWFVNHPVRHERLIIFGHWAARGYIAAPGLLGLDSGCVWNRSLTAVNLDNTTEVFSELRVDAS